MSLLENTSADAAAAVIATSPTPAASPALISDNTWKHLSATLSHEINERTKNVSQSVVEVEEWPSQFSKWSFIINQVAAG